MQINTLDQRVYHYVVAPLSHVQVSTARLVSAFRMKKM